MSQPKILFLNQVAGPLFRELAEDVAKALGAAELLTGHTKDVARILHPTLRLIPAPDYDRRGLFRRVWSWFRFFGRALWHVFRADRKNLLFIVSNPPFLPAVGWLAALVRGQRYCLLVYDLYPGLLVRLGRLSEEGLVARLWRAFNRLVWARAAMVFTIGEYMAANIRKEATGIQNLRIQVIPNWADGDFVYPVSKAQNAFACEHGQTGCMTVMYSGNVGLTHDLGTLIEAAGLLRDDLRISFLLIGGGSRWPVIQSQINRERLDRVRLLPFQPEAQLPLTLTTADVAVITLEAGVEGHSLPSKTYYALAAGAALLVITQGPNEITDLVEQYGCGLVVQPGDAMGAAAALRRFCADPEYLARCRHNARAAMEANFSRNNTRAYVAALRQVLAQS